MNVLDRKKAAAAMLGLLLGVYLFFTPTGAVRLAVAASGHPLSAVSGKVEGGFVHSLLDGTDQPGSLAEIQAFHIGQPVDDCATRNRMENWAVYKVGPFCVSKYWGYC